MTRIGLAAESRGDMGWIQDLVDRVLVEGVDWLDAETLPHVRTYPDDCRLDLHEVVRSARALGLPIYGRFEGEPGASDAQMFRAALLLMAEHDDPPEAVVLARDLDKDEDRKRGFAQARACSRWPFEVLGALADPELEAWQAAAFVPTSEQEQAIAAELRSQLGFHPHERPERLSSTHRGSPKDAKRICKILFTHRDPRRAWTTVPLTQLETHGAGCGLGDFIHAAREALWPLFSKRPP